MWNPLKTRPEPAPPDVEARLRKLETDFVQLRLEWGEVLDKVLHRLQRVAKRDRDALRDSEPTGEANGGGPGTDASPPRISSKAQLYERARRRGVWPTGSSMQR